MPANPGRPPFPPAAGCGMDRLDEFLRLHRDHQRRVAVYVRTLVPNRHDADEVLQETYLQLWRKFHLFEPGTNFPAWACKVALRQAIAWRKRRAGRVALFGPEALEAVAAEAAPHDPDRAVQLERCLGKLPARYREVLRMRYADGLEIDEMAAALGRTSGAVYRELSRIRQTLWECVSRATAEEQRR